MCCLEGKRHFKSKIGAEHPFWMVREWSIVPYIFFQKTEAYCNCSRLRFLKSCLLLLAIFLKALSHFLKQNISNIFSVPSMYLFIHSFNKPKINTSHRPCTVKTRGPGADRANQSFCLQGTRRSWTTSLHHPVFIQNHANTLQTLWCNDMFQSSACP